MEKNKVVYSLFDKNYGYDNLYSNLIKQAWTLGYEDQIIIDFAPWYLEWVTDQKENFAASIWSNEKIVGFNAFLRRNVKVNNEQNVSAVATLLSVDAMYRLSLFILTANAGIEFFDKQKNKVLFTFFDAGHSTSYTIPYMLKYSPNYGMKKICTVGCIAKGLDLNAVATIHHFRWYEKFLFFKPLKKYLEGFKIFDQYFNNICDFEEDDLDQCQDLLNSYHKNPKFKFARIWDNREELIRQLKYKDNVKTIVFKRNKKILGLINYYNINMTGYGNMVKMSFLENVFIEKLSLEETRSFFSFYLKRIKSEGCKASIVFEFRYFDQKILKQFGFISFPRSVSLVAIGEKKYIKSLKKIKSDEIYFDCK